MRLCLRFIELTRGSGYALEKAGIGAAMKGKDQRGLVALVDSERIGIAGNDSRFWLTGQAARVAGAWLAVAPIGDPLIGTPDIVESGRLSYAEFVPPQGGTWGVSTFKTSILEQVVEGEGLRLYRGRGPWGPEPNGCDDGNE